MTMTLPRHRSAVVRPSVAMPASETPSLSPVIAGTGRGRPVKLPRPTECRGIHDAGVRTIIDTHAAMLIFSASNESPLITGEFSRVFRSVLIIRRVTGLICRQ
ncbi:hypothetical protein [Crateriforma conspicua]|uniref:hypothetical protein n=1 Tax=Crateriforma conspicua TaxID=2527996 RepID=UPI0011A0C8CE|nr:hypothetical protein [Crateriforma conspicua]